MTDKTYNIKGHGYQTRGMQETSPGHWDVPMYSNCGDSSLGIFEIKATTAHRAFEIALKETRASL